MPDRRRTSQRSSPVVGHPGIRHERLPNGRVRYRVQVQVAGQRVSKIAATLEAALEIEKRLRAGDVVDTRPAPEDPEATVDDGLRHYVLDLEGRRKDGRRAEQVRGALRALLPEIAAKPLGALILEDVSAYVGARERAGIKPNTIVRDLRVFRAMLRKARPDLKVPAELFPAEDLTRVRMLTPEQRAEVFPLLSAMCGERFALIAALAMLGIMRLTEVRTLRREMIHLPARVILLPRTKGRKPRPRVVRLSDEAVTLVTRALLISPHPSWVFPNAQSGEPYSRVHISRCWRKAARACGLAGFTFHDLRHHGPTVAVNAGANSATLKAMGGWLSDASMQRYTHVLNPTVDAFMGMITTRPSPA